MDAVAGADLLLLASPWLYTVIGDIGWRLKARKHKAGKRMKDRPYLP